jgi:hypothetical protein
VRRGWSGRWGSDGSFVKRWEHPAKLCLGSVLAVVRKKKEATEESCEARPPTPLLISEVNEACPCRHEQRRPHHGPPVGCARTPPSQHRRNRAWSQTSSIRRTPAHAGALLVRGGRDWGRKPPWSSRRTTANSICRDYRMLWHVGLVRAASQLSSSTEIGGRHPCISSRRGWE